MKKQRVLTVVLTLMAIVTGLFGPALLQAGATNGPTTASPGAVVMRPDLTTKVAKLFALDFRPVAPNKPPITTVPFTADELRKTGGNRITQAGGKFFVTTKKINPATKKPLIVPIETYVAQLNDFERFLDKLGYSLRSGPADLGKILILNKHRTDKNSLPGAAERATRKQVIFDPTIYERTGMVKGTRINPVIAASGQATLPQPGAGNAARARTPHFLRSAVKEIPLPSGSAGGGTVAVKTEPVCPCVSCGLVNDYDVILNPVTVGGGRGPSGPSIEIKKALGLFCGEKSDKCEAPTCLYKGYLAGQWTGVSTCVSATDGNDWFDASLCVYMNASNCGMDGQLNLRNGGSLLSELKIFGFSIPILDIAAAGSYENGKTSQESSFKFLGEEVKPINFTQDIQGPRATFLIGPVPVTLSSSLHFQFDAGKTNFTFPTALNPSNCNASGQLASGVGLTLESHIDLDAYVDAIIAQAGVKGRLTLADDYFGAGITTTVSPSKNEVLVEPGLQYRLKHLAGQLFLYAEIDLLITSKTFQVELFNFDSGLGTNGQVVTEPFAQKRFGAINLGPKP